MALVAYDNSSASENEEEEVDEACQVVVNGAIPLPKIQIATSATDSSVDLSFTNLPQPITRNANLIEEAQDEFLRKKEQPTEKPKKVKKPVKIGILSLNNYNSDEDDNEPTPKKSKQQKGCGLFALLPSPKVTPLSTTSFIPKVLQRNNNSTKAKPIRKTPKEENESNTSETKKSTEGDDDDIELPDTFDDEMWEKVCGIPKRTIKPAVQETAIQHIVELAPEVEKPYSGLDNRAFKELVGSKKRIKENIEIIDIHEDEIRPDREEWLKSLTDPNYEPEASVENPVNNTCRVKNHITSLAQKALANDKELQMRWAESRHNRRQTQAKYGF